MNDVEFKPIILGTRESDLFMAKNHWIRAIDAANDFLTSLSFYLERLDDFDVEDFIEIVNWKSTNPHDIAYQLFMKKENKSLWGDFNFESLFDQRLLSMYLYDCIESRKKLLDELRIARSKFPFSLKDLYDESVAFFKINEKFEESIKEYFTVRTSSERENQNIQAMLKITEALNSMTESGILDRRIGIKNITLLQSLIRFENGQFKVHPRVLVNKRFAAE